MNQIPGSTSPAASAASSAGRARESAPRKSEDVAAAASRQQLARLRGAGVYVPPHRKRQLEAASSPAPGSEAHQRIAWEQLRKGINGLVNRATAANVASIVPQLLSLNLVRGRGLLARAVLKAQLASPGFTNVYAAVVAVINTRLPAVGELLVKRVVLRLRRAYRRSDKMESVALSRFVAHLVNQGVAHEVLALQLVTLLLEKPTDSSVEIACEFLKEAGATLQAEAPKALDAVFERLRAILSEVAPSAAAAADAVDGDAGGAAPAGVSPRVRYVIEEVMAARRSSPPFKDHPARVPELDLVEEDDEICHDIGLDDAVEADEALDVFRLDPKFEEGEAAWAAARDEILGADSSDDDDNDDDDGDDDEADDHHSGDADGVDAATSSVEAAKAAAESAGATVVAESSSSSSSTPSNAASGAASAAGAGDAGAGAEPILDYTEQDVVNLRKTLYLTIMNSLEFEECAHKILRLNIPQGLEAEVTTMVVECCSQEKTYRRFYGNLAARFSLVNVVYQDLLCEAFRKYLSTIHRLSLGPLRNVARLFGHLLHSDAIPWTVLSCVHINEHETTSSSRIFIKILLQDLASSIGVVGLRERLFDPDMTDAFQGLFPKANLRDTRYSINFFTQIGLGALTEGMRAWLVEAPKIVAAQRAKAAEEAEAAAKAASKRRGRGRRDSESSYDSYYDSYDSYYDSYSESYSDSGGSQSDGSMSPGRSRNQTAAQSSTRRAAASRPGSRGSRSGSRGSRSGSRGSRSGSRGSRSGSRGLSAELRTMEAGAEAPGHQAAAPASPEGPSSRRRLDSSDEDERGGGRAREDRPGAQSGRDHDVRELRRDAPNMSSSRAGRVEGEGDLFADRRRLGRVRSVSRSRSPPRNDDRRRVPAVDGRNDDDWGTGWGRQRTRGLRDEDRTGGSAARDAAVPHRGAERTADWRGGHRDERRPYDQRRPAEDISRGGRAAVGYSRGRF